MEGKGVAVRGWLPGVGSGYGSVNAKRGQSGWTVLGADPMNGWGIRGVKR
ncbi:hypothetical protein HMPREF0290_1524 [Corynebacterium efficiens YS-314]|nr:hypothetical protein HMPREF0290_1524 [Corynebacterium efficiens YS-314]